MTMNLFQRTLVCAAITASSPLFAAGLEFPWQSTSAMGTAQANAAEAADPSTIYFNPAGMTRLKGTRVSQGGQLLSVYGKFENEGSTMLDGTPTTGGNGGTYHPKLIGGGQFYVTHQMNDRLTAGLGLFVPYGANVNYKADWVGRFSVDRAAIETININPSLAFKFSENHSFGLGVSGQVMHLRLRSAADVQNAIKGVAQNAAFEFGGGLPDTLCRLLNNPLTSSVSNPTCNGLTRGLGDLLVSLSPEKPAGQGVLNVEGYGYGFGWNAGYLFLGNDEKTRIGLSYRSQINQVVKGDFDWDFRSVTGQIPNPDFPVQFVNARQYIEQFVRPDTSANVRIVTPETAILGVFQQVTERIALMANVNWTRTSRVNELRINPGDATDPNGNVVKQGAVVVRTNFRDVYKVAAGANLRLSDSFLLRAGVGYEQTPVPNPEARHASLPDANRRVHSLGLNYRKDKSLDIDLAYSYVILEDVKANYTDNCHPAGYLLPGDPVGAQDLTQCTGNGDTFRGTFKDTYLHSVGIQLNQRF